MDIQIFDIIEKASIVTCCALSLIFSIYLFMRNVNKKDKDTQEFINKVMEESNEREKRLIETLDNYNNALQDNNKILGRITTKLEVIKELKVEVQGLREDVEDIKEKLDKQDAK